MDPALASAFAADAATAAAAALNAAVLTARRARQPTPGRRAAAAVLAVLNAGIAAQAVFALALFAANRLDLDTAPFFAPGPWLASRAALLAGTLMLSALVLRARPR